MEIKKILEPTPSKCVDRWVEMYFEEKHRADVAEEALKLAVFDYKACVENEVCKKYKTKAEEILYIREQTEIEMDKILSMLKERNNDRD